MRTGKPQVGPADRRHPDEVVGAREEGRERGCERHLPDRLHTDRHADHVLLGDVALDEPIGRHLLDVLGVRGVRDLRVDHDDLWPHGERGERLTERLARRDLVLVRRQLHVCPAVLRHDGRVRLRGIDADRSSSAKLGDRPLRFLGRERLAVPPLLVRQERDTVPLLGLRDDERRPSCPLGLAVRGVDRLDVVAVNLDREPTEGLRSRGVRVTVPLEHRRPALTESVHVEDRDEVRNAVVRGVLHRFPDGALRGLRVAEQTPGSAGCPIKAHGERHAEGHRKSLAERAGRHVDPRHLGERHRVALHR